MTQTKYGLISDVHTNPSTISRILERLKSERVNEIILNGDLGTGYEMIATVLSSTASLGLQTYVQPGSHESIAEYIVAFEYAGRKHKNLVDAIETRKINHKNHDLIFIPGSDWLSQNGQFMIRQDIPEGDYIRTQEGLRTLSEEDLCLALGHPEASKALLKIVDMNNLERLVTNPEKTIVVCHVPRKFTGLSCVDVAYFAEKSDGSLMPGVALENAIREKFGKSIPYQAVEEIAKANGFTMKRQNRGNEDLTEIYSKLGLNKAINGHFHESSHRANDSNSKPVPEGVMTNNLFWNSGCADEGMAGILTVNNDGTQMSYQNLKV